MGSTVLIVEDEPLVAMDLESEFEDEGYSIAGQVSTVTDALSAIDTLTFDVALLDGNLFGESSQPVAEKLEKNKIPFVVVTGYSSGQIGDWLRNVPRVSKPFDRTELMSVVAKLLA